MAMRRTFVRFLADYCQQLSRIDTTSLKRLASAADSIAPRVAEPLFALAIEQGKLDHLLKVARGTWMETQYGSLLEKARGFEGNALAFLESPGVPSEYRKVAEAFRAPDVLRENDLRLKEIIRSKIVDALSAEGAPTRYSLHRDLGINKGNLYAFLAGDLGKMSRATAKTVLEYVQNANAAKNNPMTSLSMQGRG